MATVTAPQTLVETPTVRLGLVIQMLSLECGRLDDRNQRLRALQIAPSDDCVRWVVILDQTRLLCFQALTASDVEAQREPLRAAFKLLRDKLRDPLLKGLFNGYEVAETVLARVTDIGKAL